MKRTKIFLISALMLAIVGVFAYFHDGQAATADAAWDVEKGYGGVEITATMTDMDSVAANSTYTKWTPWPATFDAQTMYLNTYFNAGANDSCRIIVQARPFGSTSSTRIINVDSLFVVGSASPIAVYNALSLSGYGGEYRLKVNAYTSGQGSTNSAGCDLTVTWGSNGTDPFYSRPNYIQNW